MPFRYIIYLIFLAALITGTISCETTSIIAINVYQPAKIKLPDSTKKVTLINRIKYSNDNQVVKETEGKISSLGITNIAQQRIFYGIKDAFSQSDFIDTITILKYPFNEINTSKFNRLNNFNNLSLLKGLSPVNNLEALISLDSLRVEYFYTSKSVSKSLGYSQTYYERQQVKLNIFISALFSVYDVPENRVIEKYYHNDTIFWEETGETIQSAIKFLPESKDAVSEAAYWSGQYYADRFIPKWEKVDRYYFVKGNSDLRKASKLVNQDKWLEAAEIWKLLAYGGNKKIASRAALNMAVASEMFDNLNVALNWAKMSYSIENNRSVNRYISILEDRISLYEKLLWNED